MKSAAQNSIRYFRALTFLQWLTLPVIATSYAISWNRVPARLATHFDFANRPNGWMSREGSLIFMLVFGTLMLTTATAILARVKEPDPAAWGLLLLFYVVCGTIIWATKAVVAYNVAGTPVNVVPVLATGIGAAVLVVVLALASRRGPKLSRVTILAEETHSSHRWGVILGIPAVIVIALGTRAPSAGLLTVSGLTLLMLVAGAVMAWSGFRYLFTRAGVEIRTLGFRLRSIPTTDIRSYAIDQWSIAGGYGIRGVGNCRAYVWSNGGVRIKTTVGEVFLGHSEPEKIVRDLDMMMSGSTNKF